MRTRRRAGFSLVEMAIVAALVAITAGVALRMFEGHPDDARRARAATELKALRDGLRALALRPAGAGPPDLAAALGKDEAPVDPWGALYELELAPAGPDQRTARGRLVSAGPDGILEPPGSASDDLELEVVLPNPDYRPGPAPGPAGGAGALAIPWPVPAGPGTATLETAGTPDGDVVDVYLDGRVVGRNLQLGGAPGVGVRLALTTAPALLSVRCVHPGAQPPCSVRVRAPRPGAGENEWVGMLAPGSAVGFTLEPVVPPGP